jgi:hypothetical protein
MEAAMSANAVSTGQRRGRRSKHDHKTCCSNRSMFHHFLPPRHEQVKQSRLVRVPEVFG